MLLKFKNKVFGKEITFLLGVLPERKVLQWGMGNRCSDGTYVLFLDYDNVPLDWVYDEIALLQESPLFGHAYVFQTKRGYHVVFLEKHYLGVITQHLMMTSCDHNYKEVPMEYARKIWVLRQSKKKDEIIKYLGVKKNDSMVYRSNAHALYLYRIMNVPKKDLYDDNGKFDKSRDVIMGYYRIREENN